MSDRSHLAQMCERYADGLNRIGELLGGDPKRPDWDPMDAVDLAVSQLRRTRGLRRALELADQG